MNMKLPKKLVSAISEFNDHIWSLRMTIILMFIMLCWALTVIQNQRDELIVRIPPDVTEGAVFRAGEVPKASVLADTSYIWIELNTWLKDGSTEAFENLDAYQHYVGERFHRELKAQYNQLDSVGELNRKRRVTLNPGTLASYEDRVIVKVENKSWVVMLDVIIEDFYLNELVQNVLVRYPLVVEAVETNPEQNPLGLKIIGLAQQAVIIEDLN
ncbi:DUF2895 family protein [Enterovibrio norvegicus]|uniref:DUF2895 family protein n=1 Tax=Enterovibrio norvegicus TaxID=188144 RepID=UPI000C8682BF|nr:DUF2895 family protein [Enterovibrio norvegicus]PMH64431.1 hypothetical protein BCU62_15365 [Enterovibrio norvegicus]